MKQQKRRELWKLLYSMSLKDLRELKRMVEMLLLDWSESK